MEFKRKFGLEPSTSKEFLLWHTDLKSEVTAYSIIDRIYTKNPIYKSFSVQSWVLIFKRRNKYYAYKQGKRVDVLSAFKIILNKSLKKKQNELKNASVENVTRQDKFKEYKNKKEFYKLTNFCMLKEI